MDGKKNIFDQFSEQQDAWNEAPPPAAWDRLEARLEADAPAHPGRPWKPFALTGLGLLLIGILLSWQFWPQAKPNSDILISQAYTSTEPDLSNTQPSTNEEELNPEIESVAPNLEQPTNTLAPDSLKSRQSDPADEPDTVDTDLGDPALQPMYYQRREPAPISNLEDLIPVSNIAAFNYNSVELNPGNMIVTNRYGNIMDTVGSIQQYRNGISRGNYSLDNNAYLQLNTRRNDIEFQPRGRAGNAQTLTHFNWLLGSWKVNGPGGGSMENWRQVDRFTIEGRGFFIVNGDTMITDKMRIEERGNDVYYIVALDSNQNPVKFRLRSQKPGELIFSNPDNDFPKEIVVRKSDDNNFSTSLNNGKRSRRKKKEVVREMKRTADFE